MKDNHKINIFSNNEAVINAVNADQTDDINQGIIFDIQRWSIHDGPGIRTNIFLKGCPLRCLWCCNPESQETHPEIAYFPDKCIHCSRCIEDCPYNAISESDECLLTNYKICQTYCYKENIMEYPCTHRCYARAREVLGSPKSITKVIDEVIRDREIYRASGGGLTVSGGEPLMQGTFLLKILQLAKINDINTAIETCAYAPFDQIEQILPLLDFIFIDIKQMNSEKHIAYTGCDNKLILQNCLKIDDYAQRHPHLTIAIRTPIIPGYSDEPEHIQEICTFIKDQMPSVKIYELLPYHRLGRGKFNNIGKEYTLFDVGVPTVDQMNDLNQIVLANGLLNTYQ